MESILKDVLSQNGVISLLFVASFLAFIYKGIPYAVKKFDDILTTFQAMQTTQHIFFKEELQKISQTFISQIENSKASHESHDRKLSQILETQKTMQIQSDHILEILTKKI